MCMCLSIHMCHVHEGAHKGQKGMEDPLGTERGSHTRAEVVLTNELSFQSPFVFFKRHIGVKLVILLSSPSEGWN